MSPINVIYRAQRNQFREKNAVGISEEENGRWEDIWRDGLKKDRSGIYWVTLGLWKQHNGWCKTQIRGKKAEMSGDGGGLRAKGNGEGADEWKQKDR